MDIISDLLNIPQEDILSSSSYRDEDGTLVINVILCTQAATPVPLALVALHM